MVMGMVSLVIVLGSYILMAVTFKTILSPEKYLTGVAMYIGHVFPSKRVIDENPIPRKLSHSLDPGLSEAEFDINTGGDQMSLRRVQAGLVFLVRFQDMEYRQTIDSCNGVGQGTALRDNTEREIDYALCDHKEYWLVTEERKVRVYKDDPHNPNSIVSEIDLPDGIKPPTFR
ncbi:hypothetical protein BVX98_06605 [bacterium F11]|nr:hypothetical protein BVX98_06605 [bacterium F11]